LNHKERSIQHNTLPLYAPFFLFGLALFQGLLYLFLLPPWQHYDEPGHFEYAALIAHNDTLFTPGEPDPELRQEIVASMERHNFFWNLGAPPDDDDWWFHYTQFRHPPLYYTLVSLPLRLVLDADITTQLYVARSVSLILFIATVMAVCGAMREIIPTDHMLRCVVPLVVAFLPPIADLMTAVNNDVGAIAITTFFLWGSVRMIRRGISWRRLLWVIGTALVAVKVKNIAAITIALVPVAIIIAFWVERQWQWRWFVLSGAAAMVIGMVIAFDCGDAAYWYRWKGTPSQEIDTALRTDDSLLGKHTLALTIPPPDDSRQGRWLLSPLLEEDTYHVAGKTVMVGGWLWADQPCTGYAPMLAHTQRAGQLYDISPKPLELTTTPTFHMWEQELPPDIQMSGYLFAVPAASDDAPAGTRVFLDGGFVIDGTSSSPSAGPPVFRDAHAQDGLWQGHRFDNLLRNASGEETWPRLSPWVEATLLKIADPGWGRTPSLLLAALLDIERSSTLIQNYVGFAPIDGLTTQIAWGNVRFTNPVWLILFRVVIGISLLGAVWWLVKARPPAGVRPTLLFLAMVGVMMWVMAYTRVLPKISEGVVFPTARYTFPAIFPTVLAMVGGWQTLWPPRLRSYALWAIIYGTIVLNGVTLYTIWSFYRSLPNTAS
jgi:hypothetical protein